jgi:hypothetical protein
MPEPGRDKRAFMIDYAFMSHIEVTPSEQMRSPSNNRCLLKNLAYHFGGDAMPDYEKAFLLLQGQFYTISWISARSTATDIPFRNDSSRPLKNAPFRPISALAL